MAKRKKRELPKWEDMASDEILAIYPEPFLECRIGHEWTRRPIWNMVGPEVWELLVGCGRCGAKKVSLIDDKTKREIRKPYTHYPANYLTPRTGLTRADFKTGNNVRDFDRAEKDGRIHRAFVEQEHA